MRFLPLWTIAVTVTLVLALPSWGELVDPGAGLETRAERRTARVTSWQATWEGLSAEGKQNQSRIMLQDAYDDACLLDAARTHANDPDMDIPTAQEYVEDKISERDPVAVIRWINDFGCQHETGNPTANDEQGGTIHKTLVINGAANARGIRNLMPAFAEIEGVPSVMWASPGHSICCVGAACSTGGGTDYDIYLTRHKLHEAHIHLLEAIVTAEGALSYFYLVDELSELPCDTITSPTP